MFDGLCHSFRFFRLFHHAPATAVLRIDPVLGAAGPQHVPTGRLTAPGTAA